MADNIKLTVFTPVYNRADIINKLYESLRRQNCKDFEWLVIDDGSSDNISDVIGSFKDADNGFDIRFITKENGGKHTCINMATDIAKGELFFIVDSDDYLSDDAVEKVLKMYSSIEGDEQFCGVAGVRVNPSKNTIIGTTFDGEFVDATSLERGKYNITGDKSEVFITDILKKYKFPVFENEKFITENCVWLKLAADGYKIRWFNEPIYYCEYLEGGLSDLNKKNLLKSFCGDIYTTKLYIDLLHYSFIQRVREYGFAYELYKISNDKNKLDFIKKTFQVKTATLKVSYFIYKIYKLVRGKK